MRKSRGNVRPITGGKVEGEDTEWMRYGMCQYVDDPNIFFPEGGSGQAKQMFEQQREAKAVCHTCPVEPECLEFAIKTGQDHGIWGGRSEKERKRIRKIRLRNERLNNG